jgi:hypothetical protein
MSYDAMKPKYSKQIPPRAILSTKISYGQDWDRTQVSG